MLRNIVAAVKKAAVGWARSIGDAFKHRVRPARGDASIVVGAARDAVRSRSELVTENALLRRQLTVLRRSIKRPRLRDGDRLAMVLLASMNSAWPDALHLVKPETLLRWHRDLFRLFWKRKSQRRGRQPRQLTRDTVELIRRRRGTASRGGPRGSAASSSSSASESASGPSRSTWIGLDREGNASRPGGRSSTTTRTTSGPATSSSRTTFSSDPSSCSSS